MKLLLIILLLASPALALDLDEALQSAASRPDAVSARLELLNAQNALLRVENDPLALRVDKLSAEQAVRLSEAELEAAYYAAVRDIAEAYAGVLELNQQLENAQKAQNLAQESLRIAQIRLDNGGATPLDVQEAQVGLEDAQKNLLLLEKNQLVALNNLEGLIGQDLSEETLEPVHDTALSALPSLENVQAAAAGHPQMLELEQGLELSQLSLALLDPSYASTSQIEDAQTQLDTTHELAREAQRGFDLQVRNLYIGSESAAETYQVEVASLSNAEERFAFQQDRFEAGLIAQIELGQAELEYLQAELAHTQARHTYLTALADLQAGTLVELTGLDAFNFNTVANIATTKGSPQ